MASYHFEAKKLSRKDGGSAVANGAYVSGEDLTDERTGQSYKYDGKPVMHHEVLLPPHASQKFNDVGYLMNAVEKAENRKDAQLLREFEVALPAELPPEAQIEMMQTFIKRNFVDEGMIVNLGIHPPDDKPTFTDALINNRSKNKVDQLPPSNNQHAHFQVLLRDVDGENLLNKNRDWNKRDLINKWRKDFADIQNEYLEKYGHDERVDHRSFEDRGITDLIARPNISQVDVQKEERGIRTDDGDFVHDVIMHNKAVMMLDKLDTAMLKIEAIKESIEAEIAQGATAPEKISSTEPEKEPESDKESDMVQSIKEQFKKPEKPSYKPDENMTAMERVQKEYEDAKLARDEKAADVENSKAEIKSRHPDDTDLGR